MKTILHSVILIALFSTQVFGHNAINNGNKDVSVTKSIDVAGPFIMVKGNLMGINNNDTTPSTTDNTLFLSAQVAGGTRAITYTITNDGTVDLELTSVLIEGVDAFDFQVSTTPDMLILAGESTYFTVTFDPTVVGMRNAQVVIKSNDPASPVFTYAVQGKGLNYIECGYNPLRELVVGQDFEGTPAAPVWSYTVNSGVAYTLGGTAYAETGAPVVLVNKYVNQRSLQVNNSSSVVTFSPVNTMNMNDVTLEVKLGSYATSTSEGSENSDYVMVSVSTNGGASWSNEIAVMGSSQAKWSFVSGLGFAQSNYTGTDVSVGFSPAGSGFRIFDGYGNIVLTDLPNATDLRVRLTIVNNSANEIWAIDDVKLSARLEASTTWNGFAWSAGTPNTSKKAIINGNYNTEVQGSISTCKCQVNNGSILIIADNSFLSSESDLVNNGTLQVENGGSLVQKDDFAANAGNINVKRDTQPVRRYDYTYWSSPVGNQTLYNLSPNTLADKYFGFNPVVNNWTVYMNGAATMEAAKGYIVRAPQTHEIDAASIFTANFEGPANNGIITLPVARQTGEFKGWNLIGNPYPSALKIDDFINNPANENVIEGTVYQWTHNTPLANYDPATAVLLYLSDDYAVYNLSGALATSPAISGAGEGTNGNTPTGIIASGQGFFVKAWENGTVTFDNQMRSEVDNGQFFKTTAATATTVEKNRVWLDLKNTQGAFKQTLVSYITNATNGYDRKYDATTLNGNSYLNFYSISTNEKLAINGRALPFDSTEQVELGYNTTIAGAFTISINHLDGVFTEQGVYLEDKMLNVIHDLKAGPYSFTTAAGAFDKRFILRYNNGFLANQQFTDDNELAIVTQLEKIIVRSSNNTIDKIIINDVLGRQVATQSNIDNTQVEITKVQKLNQPLLVTVMYTNGDSRVKKIMF